MMEAGGVVVCVMSFSLQNFRDEEADHTAPPLSPLLSAALITNPTLELDTSADAGWQGVCIGCGENSLCVYVCVS